MQTPTGDLLLHDVQYYDLYNKLYNLSLHIIHFQHRCTNNIATTSQFCVNSLSYSGGSINSEQHIPERREKKFIA